MRDWLCSVYLGVFIVWLRVRSRVFVVARLLVRRFDHDEMRCVVNMKQGVPAGDRELLRSKLDQARQSMARYRDNAEQLQELNHRYEAILVNYYRLVDELLRRPLDLRRYARVMEELQSMAEAALPGMHPKRMTLRQALSEASDSGSSYVGAVSGYASISYDAESDEVAHRPWLYIPDTRRPSHMLLTDAEMDRLSSSSPATWEPVIEEQL